MKKELLLWAGFGFGMILSLWVSLDFQETQKALFQKAKTEQSALQNNVKALRDDLIFIKDHQKEFNFLIEKGWFIPKSRLIAGEVIEQLQSSLNEVQYIFEPESTQNLKESHTFKVTKVVMEVGALFESDVYAFVEALIENFPGILSLHELSLTRGEEINERSLLALRNNEPPNFVVGKLVFDWFSMGTENREK